MEAANTELPLGQNGLVKTSLKTEQTQAALHSASLNMLMVVFGFAFIDLDQRKSDFHLIAKLVTETLLTKTTTEKCCSSKHTGEERR